MKPEAQRIAIAEACGWKPRNHCRGFYREGRNEVIYDLPDYLNDLNAMHEAEKTLTGPQYVEFMTFICVRLTFDEWDKNQPSYYSMHATAAQRAEAFLKTLSLWTNDA